MVKQDRILLDREVKDFLLAIMVLFTGYVISIFVDTRFPLSSLPLVLLVSLFSIVLAFSAHEGAHRFVSIRLGAIAITRTMTNILISHMNTFEPSIGGMGIILNKPNHKFIL